MEKNNYLYINENMISELNRIEKTARIIVENAKNGSFTAKVESNGKYLYLHSRYNPEEESEKLYQDKHYEKENIFVAGFGMGYHIAEIQKKMRNDQKMVIFVTDPELFKYTLEIINLEKILACKNVEILIAAGRNDLINKFKEKFKNINEEEWDFVVHAPSLKTVPDKFSEIAEIIERIETNKKSVELFRPVVLENIKHNIANIIKDYKIKDMDGMYKGAVFFIVAAGPSLDKNIEYLRKVERKGVIIAVGTIAKKMLKLNIRPDFIIVVDGLGNIDRQLEGIDEKEIPLVYFPTASHTAITGYNGIRICAFPEEDPLFEDMEMIINTGSLKSGGSVATAACDLAKKLGAETIVFVGQDLAVADDGHTHVSETQFEKNKKEQIYLKKVKGNLQESVYTLKNLYVYLRWFENYIKDEKNIEFINSTEGGAYINGAKHMPLSEVIEKKCKIEIEKDCIKKIGGANSSNLEEEKLKIELLSLVEKRGF